MASTKLVCSICLEDFKSPKLLSCFHSFCKSCLFSYVQNNTDKQRRFKCPLCRSQIQLPDNGVDGFQTNFYIITKEIAGTEQASVNCDLCDSKIAFSRCIDCAENMCKDCDKTHSKMKLARGHHVACLSDPKIKFTPKSYCDKHESEEIRFLCKKCDVLICINCKLTDHEHHSTKSVEDEARSVKEGLSAFLKSGKCKEQKVALEKNFASLEDAYGNITQLGKSQIDEIKEHSLSIKKTVDTNTDSLVQEVQMSLQNVEKQVVESKERSKMQLDSFSSLFASANQILEMASDVDAIKLGKNLQKRLEDESKQKVEELPKAQLFGTEFIPSNLSSKIGGNIVGQVHPLSSAAIKLLAHLENVAKYELGQGKNVRSMTVKNGHAWIAVNHFNPKVKKRKVSIFQLHDERKNEERIKEHMCDNLCQDEQGKIYFSDGHFIRNLPNPDESEIRVPRVVRGLTYDKFNNELIAALCPTNSFKYYTQMSHDEKVPSQLIRYKLDGTVTQGQFPNWDTQLKFPVCVSVNSSGDSCVVDTDKSTSCLFIFRPNGELKAKYSPNVSMSTSLAPVLTPHNVCCDNYGYIFLCYYDSKRVDILTENGTKIQEIEANFVPTAFCVDTVKDNFWIGGKRGTIQVFNYLKK